MGSCRDIGLLLTEFLDGDLPPQASQWVTAHLADCRLCAAELDREQRLRGILGQLPPVPCPARVMDRLQAAIAREPGRVPVGARPRPAARRYFPAGIAVALAATLVVMILAYTPQVVPPRPTAAGERPAADGRTFSPPIWTSEQLQAARSDLQWTLALTAGVIERTQKATVSDIFGRTLPAAITGSLRSAVETAEGGRG